MRGFTMLEVILSVAAIGIITGIGVPVYQAFQVRNDLDVGATTIAQSLRRAQVLAEASDGDSGWGVAVATGTITLFKGATYAARDATYDEVFLVPSSIASSGLSEVAFAKLSGLPGSTGTTTLTSSGGEVRTIIINAKGTVSY